MTALAAAPEDHDAALKLEAAVDDGARVAAACLVFDSAGRAVARYDKIHLFDIDLPGETESHRESRYIAPGSAVRVIDTPVGRLGLAVCYDIRFPELFRRLSESGATWFTLPSAFTVPTGNFGNVYAGYAAQRMGLPISHFVVATNSNDILARFFDGGDMTMAGVVPTVSPSMDIQISSNFERLLFDLYGRE